MFIISFASKASNRTIFRRFALPNSFFTYIVFVMIKLDEQLKAAIVRMPAAEKDKLLLRLVAKDHKLVRRFVFELIEGGTTRDERSADLKRQIADDLRRGKEYDLTPGLLLMYLRNWNARITEHVQATKDKPGDVSLAVFMLVEAFRVHRKMLESFPDRRSDTLAPYIVKRTKAVYNKALKLHEDYFIEFRRDMQELLENIWSFRPTAQFAKEENLPREWTL